MMSGMQGRLLFSVSGLIFRDEPTGMTGGYACESEVYRNERGGPLVKLACMKTLAGAPSLTTQRSA